MAFHRNDFRRLDGRCIAWLSLVAAWIAASGAASEPTTLTSQLRRPVAISLIDQDLAVLANHQSGTVSVVNWRKSEVIDEVAVGGQLSDVAVLNAETLVVVDSQRHVLSILRLQRGRFVVTADVRVDHTPVAVRVAPNHRSCSVACLWSRQIKIVDLSNLAKPAVTRTIDLPFSPRAHLFLDAKSLIVADAFGGCLALIDCERGAVQKLRELIATHNITGLCRAADGGLLMPHQMLNHERATTGSNVHWGDVMSNVVRKIDLNWFLSNEPEQTTAAELYYLGHPDDATGDPTKIIRTRDDRQIIAFAGIDQVGVSDPGANAFRRIDVGRRPTDLALSADETTLLVANRFDDSVSVINLTKPRIVATVSLGPSPPLSAEERGEIHFYDSRLSSDGWFSCHSCHTDGHSNGQMSDTFGDGYRGAPKRVLTLLGTADAGPWAWNGKMPTLESQIAKSIVTTMRGEQPSNKQISELAAYVRTLPPAPGIGVARQQVETPTIDRGHKLFQRLGCVDCHRPDTYTTEDVHDIGLTDRDGNREFNPPSLRGVSQRNRLLHDNRASSYRESLQTHPYGKPIELTDNQWIDLRSFLDSL